MATKLRCTFGHATIHLTRDGTYGSNNFVLDRDDWIFPQDFGAPQQAMSTARRFMFLDILRGTAVLWMIQVHITNQIIDASLRASSLFHVLNISNGFVAPTFIFCAGTGLWIALSRKGGAFLARTPALWDYLRRLSYILMWGYLLHLPFFSLERWLVASPNELVGGLQIDVLQTIVYTSLLVVLMFFVVRTVRATTITSAALAVTVMCFSWYVWLWPGLDAMPIALRYLIAPPSMFPLLPYGAYLLAGFVVGGVFMESANKQRMAIVLVAACCVLPFFIFLLRENGPQMPWDRIWWAASPGVLAFRMCITVGLMSALYLLESAFQKSKFARGMQIVGNESLFIYIAHLLIVYGAVGDFLKHYLGIEHSGYATICVSWLVITLPLLAIAWWWHSLKRRNPVLARRILTAQVILLVVFFIVQPADFSLLHFFE